jgi:hypothetical protein
MSERELASMLRGVLESLQKILAIMAQDERYRHIVEGVFHEGLPILIVEPRQVTERLDALHETSMKILKSVQYTQGQVDIIMKGQCPFCHEDLVTYVKNNELRLRCVKQKKPDCKTVAWIIGTVTPTTP